MIIQIESGDAQSKRKVTVTPDEGEPYSFTADNLNEAHKSLKAQRAEGWVSPADLAKQTKVETAKENARIDQGKAAAEPKGQK